MAKKKNLSKEEKLKIAKEAYKVMLFAATQVESYLDANVSTCWERCISVDGEFFSEHQLADDYGTL